MCGLGMISQQEPHEEPHPSFVLKVSSTYFYHVTINTFEDFKTLRGLEEVQDKNKHLLRQTRTKGQRRKFRREEAHYHYGRVRTKKGGLGPLELSREGV